MLNFSLILCILIVACEMLLSCRLKNIPNCLQNINVGTINIINIHSYMIPNVYTLLLSNIVRIPIIENFELPLLCSKNKCTLLLFYN